MVFITIPWFSPAFKAGGPIQSIANMVNGFTENIEYRIFCGDSDLNDEPLQNIKKGEWVDYNAHTKVWYAPIKRRRQNLIQLVKSLNPNAIFIVGLYDWYFNIVPMLFCKADKKIISVRGMLHPGALTQKQNKKRFFLSALKMFNINRKNIFHATDETESQFVLNEFGVKSNVVVAGNFSKSFEAQFPLPKQKGTLSICTIALVSPMKNHLLILEALSHCQNKIMYNIYGPIKDDLYWQECKKIIARLPDNIDVHYHGEIKPAGVQEILRQHHLFIMPSKSENFGHSIAEALSAGRPVITSHNTPWNNLESNIAGLNTDLNKESLLKGILFFVDLNELDYGAFVLGAKKYSIKYNNTTEIMLAYKKMFFEGVTDGH